MQSDGRQAQPALEPWYRQRPGLAVALSFALFVAVAVLRWFDDGAGSAVVMLEVLPIALLACTFGLAGGLAAATVGYGSSTVVALFHTSGHVDAVSWPVGAVTMFLLGTVLGRATDQTNQSRRAALREQQRCSVAEEANRCYAEAMEISDSILQQMAAAKWKVEQGRSDEAVSILDTTIGRSQRMVAGLLDSVVGRGGESALQR